MAIVRLGTGSDATWQRAWSVADAAERATLIATYLTTNGPKRGDIIYQIDTTTYYFVVTANVLQPVSGLLTPPVDLTTQVTGVLPVANGGAGKSSGTWTPIDTSGDGLVLVFGGGKYVKLDDVVFITGQVVYPATASATPSQLGGLPFTVGSSNASPARSSAGAAVDFSMYFFTGTTNFRAAVIGTGIQPTNAQMANSNTIFTGFYFV